MPLLEATVVVVVVVDFVVVVVNVGGGGGWIKLSLQVKLSEAGAGNQTNEE